MKDNLFLIHHSSLRPQSFFFIPHPFKRLMSSTLSQPRVDGHEDAARDAALTNRLRGIRPRFWRKRWPALVVVAVAVLALAPAMLRGVPSNIDLWNHYRL